MRESASTFGGEDSSSGEGEDLAEPVQQGRGDLPGRAALIDVRHDPGHPLEVELLGPNLALPGRGDNFRLVSMLNVAALWAVPRATAHNAATFSMETRRKLSPRPGSAERIVSRTWR